MTTRRKILIALGASSLATPLVCIAQKPTTPVIGWLDNALPTLGGGVRKGLSEMGYVEGRNVVIESRVTEQYDRLPELAAELVRRQVSVIFAASTANAAQAAKAATSTIPIVFANGSDPVKLGLVASMNRPGGNVTGVSLYVGALMAKRLELIRELVPRAATIGFLTNPTNLISAGDTKDIHEAAHSVGQQISVLNAGTAQEIDAAFARAARQRIGALVIDVDNFFYRAAKQLVALAARYRIPTIYATRRFVEAGGLLSYGDDRQESYRLAGVYIGRVLKGDKPSDLPVIQPTKFELLVNMKTAKALGVKEIPYSIRLRADKMIE